MPLTAIAIEGYRSVRRLYVPIGNLSVFVGGNGVGKSNLYNGLGLLRAAASGTITHAIAEEGGVESVLWAGQRKKHEPIRLVLTAHLDQVKYIIEIGLPAPVEGAFRKEPRVKEERRLPHRLGLADSPALPRHNHPDALCRRPRPRGGSGDAVRDPRGYG